MAERLEAIHVSMGAKSGLFPDDVTGGFLGSLELSTSLSRQRCLSAQIAGPNQLAAIWETVFSELVMGTAGAARIANHVYMETGPDLGLAIREAWGVITSYGRNRTEMLAIRAAIGNGCDEFGQLRGWLDIRGDGTLLVCDRNRMMSIDAKNIMGSMCWVSKIANTGINISDSTEEARDLCESAVFCIESLC